MYKCNLYKYVEGLGLVNGFFNLLSTYKHCCQCYWVNSIGPLPQCKHEVHNLGLHVFVLD
jgi:hypothetical protein